MDKISATSSMSVAWSEKLLGQLSDRKQANAQQDTAGQAAVAGSSASFSGAASVYRELYQLQQSDPEQFKQVTSDIATQMTQAAATTMSSTEKAAWTDMASRFEQASQTGEASQIMPPTGGASTTSTYGRYAASPTNSVGTPAVSDDASTGTTDGASTASSNGESTTTSDGGAAAPAGRKGGGGPPPSGGSSKTESTSSDTSSNEVYDKRDADKDGEVSVQEDLAWEIKHPEDRKPATGAETTPPALR